MNEATTQNIEFAPGKTISLETGRLARQAGGAVVVRMGDTMVLCTAVLDSSVREGQHFFPLTVDYREKFSAAGSIPGGFFKREGRPTDKEVLSSRLIDRALRPLFPDGFYHETQVIAYVISADDENDADVLAGVGASAAMLAAGAPFDGPIAEVRVGRVDGQFIVNPTVSDLEESDINLIVAGKQDSIVMVEGEMDEITEEEMVQALEVAHDAIRKLCEGQEEFIRAKGEITPFEYRTDTVAADLTQKISEQFGQRLADHIRQPYEKGSFYGGIGDIKQEAIDALLGPKDSATGERPKSETPAGYTAGDIKDAVSNVERDVLRGLILDEDRRLDGRGLSEVRELWMETGYLPRVHGSAIFTRGETQVLGSVTLGTSKDVQPIDQIFDQKDKPFFLHYNFPPFCTGEARFLRGPKRREIGHGYLAERALEGVLPEQDNFPYTIRINADVLESNGSSSMASVCAGSLALMDAGVPIKKPVAGIAMGMITDGSRTKVLTDILGTEDHLGDMDFKLTGTRDGITACQMDIKIKGLESSVLLQALEQAREARRHILDAMDKTLFEPRQDLSPHAPRLTMITVDGEFIGAIIGPGGKVIKSLQSETDTEINIDEEDGMGYVTIASKTAEGMNQAIDRIKQIVAVPEEGATYTGVVKKVVNFGAFVEIMPGKTGLLHVSELDHSYVENVDDYVQVGDQIEVKLLEMKRDGKMRLSRKPLIEKPQNGQEDRQKEHSR